MPRDASGNWIDNVEIYADRKPQGGEFSAADLRVTTTNAGGMGDNGYTPRIAAGPSGRITIAWYDFTANASASDLYLKTSDSSGAFNWGEAISACRLTNELDRGGSPSFTVPDLAIGPDGARHLVWNAGEGSGENLYYAEVSAGGESTTQIVFGPRVIAAGGSDFYEPAHVAAAPNGDVWVAFGDETYAPNEKITLLRRRAGAADFDTPIAIDPVSAARQTQPDLKIDALGRVHLAWIDARAGTHVYYALYDPSAAQVVESRPVTAESGEYARPSLALDRSGRPFILFERSLGAMSGDIWFAAPATPASANEREWRLYE